MDTNRRGFFGVAGSLMATAVLDPERLLWVPGKTLISIPSERPKAFLSLRFNHPYKLGDHFRFDTDLYEVVEAKQGHYFAVCVRGGCCAVSWRRDSLRAEDDTDAVFPRGYNDLAKSFTAVE